MTQQQMTQQRMTQQEMTEQLSLISSGWEVYGSDNDKIGTVDEVGPNYVVVRKGLIFTKDVFVPHSAIDHLDTQQTRIFLNVPKGRIDEMGWDDVPGDAGWTEGSGPTGQTQGTGTTGQTQGTGTTGQTYRSTDDTEFRERGR